MSEDEPHLGSSPKRMWNGWWFPGWNLWQERAEILEYWNWVSRGIFNSFFGTLRFSRSSVV